jgi:hypothetical protein
MTVTNEYLANGHAIVPKQTSNLFGNHNINLVITGNKGCVTPMPESVKRDKMTPFPFVHFPVVNQITIDNQWTVVLIQEAVNQLVLAQFTPQVNITNYTH